MSEFETTAASLPFLILILAEILTSYTPINAHARSSPSVNLRSSRK